LLVPPAFPQFLDEEVLPLRPRRERPAPGERDLGRELEFWLRGSSQKLETGNWKLVAGTGRVLMLRFELRASSCECQVSTFRFPVSSFDSRFSAARLHGRGAPRFP